MLQEHGRKAVSGILGAVFLFAIVFTTGATYFTFVTLNMQNLNTELLSRNQMENNRLLERYTPVSFFNSSVGTIGLNITNSGSISVKIVAIVVYNSTLVATLNGQPGSQTTPNLPIFINPVSTKATIDTGIKPKLGETYSIRVLSDRGNMAQTTYPEIASAAVVAASLISKGVGDVQMSFTTLKWATQMIIPLVWNDGAIIAGGTQKVIWKVNLTNHSQKDIFLSHDSILTVIRGGGSNTEGWYVIKSVNEQTGAITALGDSEYIKIPADPYNVAKGGTPVTVYFTATVIGGTTPETFPAQADVWMVMIGLTGTYTTAGSSETYSQLIPFKTIRAN